MFKKLFSRYEADYEKEIPGMIEEILTLIWASRHGLSEKELIGIVKESAKDMAQLYWSRFYIPAEHLFLYSSGLLNFSFDYLRTAVEEYYLTRALKKTLAHQKIACYFAKLIPYRSADMTNGLQAQNKGLQENYRAIILIAVESRIIDEIGWQYYRAEQWQELSFLLSDSTILANCWSNSSYDTKIYWTAIHENTDMTFTKAYKDVVDKPERFHYNELDVIARLSRHFGNTELSIKIRDFLLSKLESTDNRYFYLQAKMSQASNMTQMGIYSIAIKLLTECEEEGREKGFQDVVLDALNDHASIFHMMGLYEDSLGVARQTEKLSRETKNRISLTTSLTCQASSLNKLGRNDEALVLLNELLLLARDSNDQEDLIYIYGELATAFLMKDDLKKSYGYIKQKEELCLFTGNNKSLAAAYELHASILDKAEKFPEALRFFKLAEEKYTEVGFAIGMATTKFNLGSVLIKMNTYDQALFLLQDSLVQFRKLTEDTQYLIDAQLKLIDLLIRMEKYTEALEHTNETIKYLIRIRKTDDLHSIIIFYISVLGNMNKLNEVYNVMDTIEKEFQEAGSPELYRNNQNLIHLAEILNKLREHQDNELQARKTNEKMLLHRSLEGQLTIIMPNRFHWKKITNRLLDERQALTIELDLPADQAEVYWYRGMILNEERKYQESVDILGKSMELAKKCGNGGVYWVCVYEIGKVYKNMGNRKEALEWFNAALSGFIKLNAGGFIKDIQNKLKEIELINISFDDQSNEFESKVHDSVKDKIKSSETEVSNEVIDREFEVTINKLSEPEIFDKYRNIDTFAKEKILSLWFELHNNGRTKEAIRIIQELSKYFADHHRFGDMGTLLALFGSVLLATGRLDEAMHLFEEQEGVSGSIADQQGLANAYANKAHVFLKQNKDNEALKFFEKEEKLLEDNWSFEKLQINYNKQLRILIKTNDTARIKSISKKLEALCIQMGDHDKLADTLNIEGLSLAENQKFHEAIQKYQEAEQLYRKINNKDGIQIVLGNQALSYNFLNDTATAMKLCKEKEAICLEINNKKELAVAYGIQAIIFSQLKDFNSAFDFYTKEGTICREIGALDRLQVSIGNKASILIEWGRLDEALTAMKEKEQISRKISNSYGLMLSILNQGVILFYMGKYRESLSYANEALNLAKVRGNNSIVQNAISLTQKATSKMEEVKKQLEIESQGDSISISNQVAGSKSEQTKTEQERKYALILENAESAFNKADWDKAFNLFLNLIQAEKFDVSYLRFKMALCRINSLDFYNPEIIANIEVLKRLLQDAGENERVQQINDKLVVRLETIKKAEKPWWKKLF